MNISSSMLNYVWGYDIDFDIPKDPYKYEKMGKRMRGKSYYKYLEFKHFNFVSVD